MCRLLYNLEWDLIQRIELVNPFTTTYIRELKTITQAWFLITCTSYVSYWSWFFFGRFRVTIVSLASLISIFYFQYFQPVCFRNSHYCSSRCTIFPINQRLYQSHPPCHCTYCVPLFCICGYYYVQITVLLKVKDI